MLALLRQSRGLCRPASILALLFCSHAPVRSQLVDTARLRAIDMLARQGSGGFSWLEHSTRTIGHRLTGSENGRRAEENADSLFRAAGLPEVGSLPFSAPAWRRGNLEVDLRVGHGERTRLDAVALAMTPDSALVQAEVIDLGNGLAADLDKAGERIKGRIGMVNLQLVDATSGTPNLHRSEKTALAIQHGAAGVLFVNNVPGHVLLTGTASVNSTAVPIPAVCIGHEDGAALRAALASGSSVTATIRMRNTNSMVQARNVFARIPGSVHPEEVVLVGGHLDCWDLATGATDNGLGAYSILDMARCLSALNARPARTIEFVLFMGEEQGLLGSSALVAERKANGTLDRIKCMVNLDMSGHPRGFNVFGPEALCASVKEAQQAMRVLDTTYAAEFSAAAGLHSDHQPFMLQGIPVLAPICDLGEHVYHCYHSSCDDVQLVQPSAMVDNVRRVGQLVWCLANAPSLPAALSDAELMARLQADGLEEKLRLQGEWRW